MSRVDPILLFHQEGMVHHAFREKSGRIQLERQRLISPNKKSKVDTCRPKDLLRIIKEKGMEIAEPLTTLRALKDRVPG